MTRDMLGDLGLNVIWITIFVGGFSFIVVNVLGLNPNTKLIVVIPTIVFFAFGFVCYKIGEKASDDIEPQSKMKRLLISSGEIVVGDAHFELPGTVIENVPNGLCEITYAIEFGAIVRFEIHFPTESNEEEHKEQITFTINGGIVMIADARGLQVESDVHRDECRRRFEGEFSRSFWQALRSGDYSYVFEDASSKPWALAISPLTGNTEYDLDIRRRGEVVSSIRCEIV